VRSPSGVRKRFCCNLISADRLCWQQIVHLFVLKVGVRYPQSKKLGYRYPSTVSVNHAYAMGIRQFSPPSRGHPVEIFMDSHGSHMGFQLDIWVPMHPRNHMGYLEFPRWVANFHWKQWNPVDSYDFPLYYRVIPMEKNRGIPVGKFVKVNLVWYFQSEMWNLYLVHWGL